MPSRDERHLFEMLVLEGAQAGLAWITVLRKRKGYRRAFHDFDVERVARLTEADQLRLREDAGIVRNRLKIASAVRNARAWLRLVEERGAFADYLWDFVDGRAVQHRFRSLGEVPASTELSDRISEDLKGRGFNFVGSTIVYAYMQSVGLVNDHVVGCHRFEVVAGLG